MTPNELERALLAAFRTHVLAPPGQPEEGARVQSVHVASRGLTVTFVNLTTTLVETRNRGPLPRLELAFGTSNPAELAAWIQIELDEHVCAVD